MFDLLDLVSRENFAISSAIGRHVWERGSLFPGVRHSIGTALKSQSLSFGDLQRSTRLPARLTLFVLAMLGSRVLLRGSAPGLKALVPLAYTDAAGARPLPALLYGQRFITSGSAGRRARLAARLAGGRGRRVVFLGDDDLVSLWLATIAPSLEISVLEIDTDLRGVLSEVAAAHRLKVEVVEMDLFQPLPDELKYSFDLFVADPFPTPDSSFEMAFISQGLQLLRPAPHSVGLVAWAPTHKAPGFGRILRSQLRNQEIPVEALRTRCDYELIEGEFTTVEKLTLEKFDPLGTAISHSKEHLLLRHATREGPADSTPSLAAWATYLERHDLTARARGSVRWSHVATPDGASSKSDTMAPSGVAAAVDPTALLRDLMARGHAADSKWATWPAAVLIEALRTTQKFGSEVDLLLSALANGPVHDYCSRDRELELYLLSRLYESYFRPPNLLNQTRNAS